jgi:ribose-phosphate pyrophosphokinase
MITFKAKTSNGEIIRSALSSFSFPAGEAHIKREERRELEPTEIAIIQPTADSLHDDLFSLLMWSNYVYNTPGQFRQVLIMPYFPGARADRGLPFGAGEYSQFVYGTAVDEIIIYDPHSEVIVEQLNYDPEYFKVTPVYPHEILNTRDSKIVMPNVYDGVIAPDKGAVTRAGAVAEAFQVPLYTSEKVRDFQTGKLSGFKADEKLPATGTYLIVDDICDGGGTFMGQASAIKEKSPEAVLDLYVSHGVFSNKALEILPTAFRRIFTTDSYGPHRNLNGGENSDTFRSIDIIRPLLKKVN